MAIKNINVNGQDYPIGGSGSSAAHAQLFNSQRDRKSLFIVCDEGALQPTDKVRFARYIGGTTGKSWGRPGAEDDITRIRYRGWIVPHDKHGAEYIHLGVKYRKTLNGREYWEVVDEDGRPLKDCISIESTAYMKDKPCIGFFVRVDRKCGLAVVRDGVQITDYLHFRMQGHTFGLW